MLSEFSINLPVGKQSKLYRGYFLTAHKMLKSLLNMRREIESEDRFTMEGGADLSITDSSCQVVGKNFRVGEKLISG